MFHVQVKVDSWKAKCPSLKAIVAGFRGKVASRNRTLGVPGCSETRNPKVEDPGVYLVGLWHVTGMKASDPCHYVTHPNPKRQSWNQGEKCITICMKSSNLMCFLWIFRRLDMMDMIYILLAQLLVANQKIRVRCTLGRFQVLPFPLTTDFVGFSAVKKRSLPRSEQWSKLLLASINTGSVMGIPLMVYYDP